MNDGDKKPLTPKEGCEECQRLRAELDRAVQSKSYVIRGPGSLYRHGKSRSRQYKQVQDLMYSSDNAERLAHAELRMHEIEAHEGFTDSNSVEYLTCMQVKIRGGRDRA